MVGDGRTAGSVSLTPSIIINVDPKSKIAQNEAFAPVSVFYTFETDDGVVEMANARPDGLSASEYTKSFERGLKMNRLLEFGQV